MQVARVVLVHIIVVGVLGVIVDVLIGLDEVRLIYVAIFVVIFCIWRCTLYITSKVVLVALVTSMYRGGVGNDSSLGTCSLTLGST